MKKGFISLVVCLMACCMTVSAQEVQKSELQKSAEAALERSAPVTSRHQYIRAYEDYFNKGKLKQGVECAAKASELYVKESEYQEAFDLLRSVDQAINAKSISTGEKAAAHTLRGASRILIVQRYKKYRCKTILTPNYFRVYFKC